MKKYWKGLEELSNDTEFVKNAEKEFPEYLPVNDSYGDNSSSAPSRRDFLKLMGFSIAAVSLASCETPVRKAIPYLNKPESIEPGVPNYYASTYTDGGEYCSVVVKTREGRPILVEGNTFSDVTMGGVNARVSASVLSLYDKNNAQKPQKGGKDTTWAVADKEVAAKLAQISRAGGQIRLVSNTILSPSAKRAIDDFAAKYPGTEHIMYDAVSSYGLTKAHENKLPAYNFSKAEVIASFGADFLGTWISPITFTKQYAQGRKVGKSKKTMSRHYQFESVMSLSGANADYRSVYKPSQEGAVIAALYDMLASKAGGSAVGAAKVELPFLKKCAEDLLNAKGKALVVSGSNDANIQVLVRGINEMLSAYGSTIDTARPSYQKQGNDEKAAAFVKDVTGNKVKAVIFLNCNPVYDHPSGTALAGSLSKIELSVSTATVADETASLCQYLCPTSHYLESWGDAEPVHGKFSLTQPTISTIFDTRQFESSLLKWAGIEADYRDYVRDFWKNDLFAMQTKETDFEGFWNRSLHNGVFQPEITAAYQSSLSGNSTLPTPSTADSEPAEGEEVVVPVVTASVIDVSSAAAAVKKTYKAAADNATELIVIERIGIGSGSQANNPYLQEVPDPISKVCWGDYISVSQKYAKANDLQTKEGVTPSAVVKVGSEEINLPVIVQPGQADNTVALSVGYGRTKGGKVAAQAKGVNAYPFTLRGADILYAQFSGVSIAPTGEKVKIAQTQTHQTFMGRETIIQESVLAEYKKKEDAGRYRPTVAKDGKPVRPESLSLWDVSSDGYSKKDETAPKTDYESKLWKERHPDGSDMHQYPDHHWGMAIDLNSCTGCSACIVACNVENNVPVVGEQEVVNRREMHWMRIDRYYSSDAAPKDYTAMEEASDNPQVVFQPMMCQHCNNAPCETVCPVAATTHSSEGLNQMTYNRCVGTKYCANNCPFKVRRFNWFKYYDNDEFDYHMNDGLGKMVLNPDVTVRSRGVMEKCSLCVQRIQLGKLTAKMEKRPMRDGDASTACASACPADAIVFGDLNDTTSQVSQLLDYEYDKRAYNVLSEIGVKPNVWYLTKIRNKDKAEA